MNPWRFSKASLFIKIQWRLLERSLFNLLFFNPWHFLEVSSFNKAYLGIMCYIIALIRSIIALIQYLGALKKRHWIMSINIPLQNIGPFPPSLTHQTFPLPFQNPQILRPKSPNVQDRTGAIGDLAVGHHHKSLWYPSLFPNPQFPKISFVTIIKRKFQVSISTINTRILWYLCDSTLLVEEVMAIHR